MNKPGALLSVAFLCMLLAACGSGANTPAPAAPPTAAKADVIVTIDGQHRTCIVALHSEAQGSTIACDEVMPFIRDELRVPNGGTYDLLTISEVGKADLAKVEVALNGAGYRPSGSPRAVSN
jgi:hypothetical protein